MYNNNFGFKESPFNMTPDPKFLYLSEQHEDALSQLVYGINNKKGFLLVTGEVGTGKTTICRSLLERISGDTETSLIFNPYLSDSELLKSILDDFGAVPQGNSIKDMLDALNEFLLKLKKERKNAVLIIDEAQNLPVNSMELVRMLSNFETDTEKLLQIVLIGQVELKEKLAGDNLRQLNQRITIRAQLAPLSVGDTKGYIYHRLSRAGYAKGELFSSNAIKEVYKHTKGYPRLINSLCDRALLCAYSADKKNIDNKIIDKAAKDVFEAPNKSKNPEHYKYLLALTLVALFVAITQRNLPPVKANVKKASNYVTVKPKVVIAPITEAHKKKGIFKDESGWHLTDDLNFSLEVSAMNLLAIWKESAASLEAIKDLKEPSVTFENLLEKLNQNGVTLNSRFRIIKGKMNLQELVKLDFPAIITIRDEKEVNLYRYCLAVQYSNDFIKVVDSENGATNIALDEFSKRYTQDAIVIFKYPFSSDEILKLNTVNDDIAILEESLKELEYFAGNPDKKFDAQTQKAVIKFQKDNGLKPDGYVGEETKLVLIKNLNKFNDIE